jgi:hypothetical protein
MKPGGSLRGGSGLLIELGVTYVTGYCCLSGKIIARTTVQHVTREDISNEDVRRQ